MSATPTTDWRRRLLGATSLLVAVGALVPAVAGAALPDGRGWEMVSPVEKNGGAINAAGSVSGGGVLQASADGQAITYSSAASFGDGPQSAPAGSQYLSRRSDSGWSLENLTVPIFAGTFGVGPNGVPYQLFSSSLDSSLLLNGFHCRAQEGGCPVANPPLAGTDAPAGYQDYYVREDGGLFEALVGSGDVTTTGVSPADFNLAFAGASPDLAHVALSTCAALTTTAAEVPVGEGCDPTKPNLYEWSQASGLTLVNATPGATLAAQSTAISSDGSRVYWVDSTGKLFMHQGSADKQVDTAAGGGGSFQVAAPDGSVAFFTKAAHLWRFEAGSGVATDLTPSGGVEGMLGASDDGSRAYYGTAAGVFLWEDGATVKVVEAPEAVDAADYPPTTGTSRVSADGGALTFVSHAPLTGYDNRNQKEESVSESEVFLYEAGPAQLRCVSCRTSTQRPIGSATIPGSVANGEQAGATDAYRPRVLSADGTRVFFDSEDALVASDTNREPDVYQWEAPGPNCAKAVGCISLLSSGRAEGGAAFVDASLSGDDVFFVTDGSLVGGDPGGFDLYDARVGGGFEEALEEIPCFGDACQSLPSEPVDPALSTLITGPGNPRITYVKHHRKEKRHCRGSARAKGRKCQKATGGHKGQKNGGKR